MVAQAHCSWQSPAMAPGSKPKVAAVLAQSLGFRVDSMWRCKGKGSLPGAATSSVLLSGEEGTSSLMLGLCSERLKCVFSRSVRRGEARSEQWDLTFKFSLRAPGG